MLTTQVALVPLEKLGEQQPSDFRDLLRVAAALQTQLTRDFGPIWDVSGVVSAFLCLEDVPPQYLPLILDRDNLPQGEHGFHLAADGRPFALVHWGGDWSVTASHELMEMVLDPAGVLTTSARSLRDVYHEVTDGQDPWPGASAAGADRNYKTQGMVDYLVEVCDAVEDAPPYTIDGINVSDFVTPGYYSFGAAGQRYSFLGAIEQPFQICDGGYLSWRTHDPKNSVWQAHAKAGDGRPPQPPVPVCGTLSDHLHIDRLKDHKAKPPRTPGMPEDDFISRFSRDQVSVRMIRQKRVVGAAAAAGPPSNHGSWRPYGARFREDVDAIIAFLNEPSPPSLPDIIHLLELINSRRDTAADPPVPPTAEELASYGIPRTSTTTGGQHGDLDAVIKLLKQQEKISSILDSNAMDPDLASWLCRLMP